MSNNRAQRATEQIHAELARLIREEIKDPRVRNLSITHVQVSQDLGHVSVWVSPLGGQGDGKPILRGLERAAGFLGARLGRLLRLRVAPALSFRLDAGVDSSVRLTRLLSRLEEERVVPAGEEVRVPGLGGRGEE